jgi:hypothetical protein
MPRNPEFESHQQWIAYVQPVGLLVSPPALVAAQAFANRNIVREQQALLSLVENETLNSLPPFCIDVLGWRASDLAGAADGPPLPDSLSVPLPEYGETLVPTYAVPDPDQPGWLMLIQVLSAKTDFDTTEESTETADRHWQASPQARFERLLRENDIPVGLLFNGVSIRVVYAPRGESSGHGTFRVKDMTEVAGRPILSALHMLLEADRLFTLPTNQRLLSILRESRKYQSEVSNALAEQVFGALNELLRGFQAADAASQHFLFREMRTEARTEIYGGLLTSLMRLVFILYAEDRGLLPTDSVYTGHYSVAGLFERLREDASRYPDTMDQRYGAWAQLITLFRLIYDGGGHGPMHLPRRYGRLFDPDAYPFLEGRPYRTHRVMGDTVTPPRVSDGVVYRVLENLLLLEGDRLSYRALDVEQIGSVYAAMMGYELEVAADPSIAVRPHHVVVNLNDLLEKPAADRAKFLKETTGCDIAGQSLDALKAARIPDEVVAAFGRKVSPRTPRILSVDAMYLQPSEERRRSGAHYTPRSLTEPIVRTTLRPVFERLGEHPTPEQILSLKVCDPAMGSGALLVEACRWLGDRLVEAWQFHRQMPSIPPDEDPYLHARRLVAQRCLYGVDKNPFAVDLAKLSLWLATLAKDHPFTFLDHALRHGDSLVGLTREQIMCFNWVVEGQIPLLRESTRVAVDKALELRRRIERLADSDDGLEKSRLLQESDKAIDRVRMIGDCVIAAFFASDKAAGRKAKLKEYWGLVERALVGTGDTEALEEIVAKLRIPPHGLSPFHWELEFPEVFARDNAGFDAIVGNPPFGGKNTVIKSNRDN